MNQLHFDTSELLRIQGINHVVLCPGSRNAPLIMSFGMNQEIQKFSFVDERSGAYAAMGLAIAKMEPVAICCTSGTALLNCYPAVAEAFYLQIPLIVVSADRPPSWIDQQDGQTIRQSEIMRNHVKKSYDLPVDLDHADAQWEYQRKLREAVNRANSYPRGPVHINIPFREPFYPGEDQKLQFSQFEKLPPTHFELTNFFPNEFLNQWNSDKRILAIVGQNQIDSGNILDIVRELIKKDVPILTEATSNISGEKGVIPNSELILMDKAMANTLKPEVVLTLGQVVISKGLKQYLRNAQCDHWHVHSNDSTAVDTFKSLRGTLSNEFKGLPDRPENGYSTSWKEAKDQLDKKVPAYWKGAPYSDLTSYHKVLSSVPNNVNLHFANSMAVRYASIIGVPGRLKVYCNRGTSGIDGSNATAVGITLASEKSNVLITGDLSLFYDRNAFLHNHELRDFKIIVFNNFEGGIFDLIKGPQAMNATDRASYMKTQHKRDFRHFSQEFGFEYAVASDEQTLGKELASFWDKKEKALLEIQTHSEVNSKAFQSFKDFVSS